MHRIYTLNEYTANLPPQSCAETFRCYGDLVRQLHDAVLTVSLILLTLLELASASAVNDDETGH